jgi:PAS domain S-box-containing protein
MSIEEELVRQRGALLENIPVVTFHAEVAPAFRMVYVSPQLESLFGIPVAQVRDEDERLLAFIHEEDHPRLRDEVFFQLSKGDSYVLEFRLLTPNGARWVRLHAGRVRSPEGEVRLHQGVIIDIGEHRAIEEALLAAKHEAERLSEAKTRFLSIISHELRTPLHAILGFGRVLERGAYGPLNERQLTFLDDLLQAGEHMRRLIDDLLDLQRVNEKRDQLSPQAQPLGPLVRDAMRMIRALAAERGQALVEDVPEELPEVVVDARALVQIVTNLVTNAIKYTSSGGRIELRARRAGAGAYAGMVVVEIEDDGAGIAPEDQARIFEYFSQVDEKVPHRLRGSGLGLALTRALVERLGGTIMLDSRPGQGSIFRFTLPTSPGAAPRPDADADAVGGM